VGHPLRQLTSGNWRCDVCLRDRKYEEIDVAHHSSTDGHGITTHHNVKFCIDNPMCRRAAMLRDHTDLACRRLAQERDALQKALFDVHEKLVWQRGVFALVAFIAGFVIRGAL